MEVEDHHEELLKHVCKLCNKRFPNGKSLGGHMRSHVTANSYGSLLKVKVSTAHKASNFDVETEGRRERESRSDYSDHVGGTGGPSGYGLRENPKKTWRVADAGFNEKQERVCKQCGKGFKSLKALCGHMSSHSVRERSFSRVVVDDDDDDDDSWANEEEEVEEEEDEEEEDGDKEFVMESQVDNVIDADPQASSSRPKRSREVRYNNLAAHPFSLANIAYCSNSSIEQEQEEVAKCLMMLSRDSGQRYVTVVGTGVNFMTESSDNNSVILEDGLSSNHVGMGRSNKDLKYGSNGLSYVEMEEPATKKLVCVEMDSSDSGYFENGAKELDSDGSADGFSRTYGYNNPHIASGSRVEALVQLEKTGHGVDRSQLKHDLRSRIKTALDYYEAQESCSKKIVGHGSASFQAPKTVQRHGKFECSICHEILDTHQALGGHKMKHKRAGSCSMGSMQGSDEHNIENGSSPKSDAKTLLDKKIGSKKTKGHKCPYCPKVFKSGQALGGHKRSHMIGAGSSARERANSAPSIKEKLSLLDLNLPAPVEEDANGHVQFMPC